MKTIIDTSYLVAVLDTKDALHKEASLIEQRLISLKHDIVYLDCVVNEVINVCMRRLKERKRSEEFNTFIAKLEAYVPEENITWAYPSIEDYYSGVLETVRRSQGILNFHDALIIHVAREFEIGHIVSFDADFDGTKLKRIKSAADL